MNGMQNSNRANRAPSPRAVSPQVSRKSPVAGGQAQSSVLAAFEKGNYLGHVMAKGTTDKTQLANDCVFQLLKTIDHGGKKVKRPFSLVMTAKGLTFVDDNTNATAAFVPLKHVACITLNSNSKTSSKAKYVALLARDTTADVMPGELPRFVCHVFALKTIQDNWNFYNIITSVAQEEKARLTTPVSTPLNTPPAQRRVGWA